MARLRFVAVALLALAVAGNSVQTGRTDDLKASPTPPFPLSKTMSGSAILSAAVASAEKCTCKIYALGDMGYDADLGKWIARTIPEVVEPETWKGSGVLRYYAPKNVLVVRNSPVVQTKVAEFLKNLKKSLPLEGEHLMAVPSKTGPRSTVVPAEHREPRLPRSSSPLPEPSAYPVPAPAKAPKHLFHFLIRYEGEGIIDDNVVKFMKGYTRAMKDESAKARETALLGASLGAGTGGLLRGAAGPDKEAKPKEDKKDDKKEKSDDPQP
jgi:hypothetical protein